MEQPFEKRKDAEIAASPEEVWEAIATGPGIDSWSMGRNHVRPGTGGTVRTVFGGYAPVLDITAWDPPRRFAYSSSTAPDGRFIAYEFLIEGRAEGSTVVRVVTSGFIPGDDWAEEYEAMTSGVDGYFSTLVEYLEHFRGRFAVPVTVFGPLRTDWERDRMLLSGALGVHGAIARGDMARFALDRTGPVDGVVYHSSPNGIGIRSADAFFRFLRGFGKPVVASHQLFAANADAEQAALEWQAWLDQVLNPNERTSL
jgi:uncharacterized protein YndB with AHSA1/START domain